LQKANLPTNTTIASVTMDTLFAFTTLPGHLSYVLIALSYYLTNMFWLRLTAIAGLFLEIIYFRLTGASFTSGIGWDLIFILINAYQLIWLLRDHRALRLPEADAPLLREALAGLNDAQIARLLKAAEWKELQPGEILTRQDAPVDALYFLLSGRVNVDVNDTVVTTLERGAFVGEIAYLTGNPATATVIVDQTSRLLAFSKMKMARIVASDEHISGIIYQLLGRDLAMKMRRSNTRRVLLDDDLNRS
jgi:CRP-like cAMP-binding protein